MRFLFSGILSLSRSRSLGGFQLGFRLLLSVHRLLFGCFLGCLASAFLPPLCFPLFGRFWLVLGGSLSAAFDFSASAFSGLVLSDSVGLFRYFFDCGVLLRRRLYRLFLPL